MGIDLSNKTENESKRVARNRGLRKALITTVVARISGVLLQVVSLPIAAMQLGPAGFTIYAMLGALLAAMTLSNLGIGQATTLHMARALATNQIRSSRELFLTSLLAVGGLALAVASLIALSVLFSSLLLVVFALHLDGAPPPVAASLFVCAVLLVTQLLSVFEAAQLAQQRQHMLNIATAIGTLIAAASVWWVASTRPTILSILVAVHIPVLLARTINAIGIWLDLNPRFHDLAAVQQHLRSMVADGLRFVSGTTISNFLCHPFSVLAMGLYATPLSSASFAAVMNALILASTVFNLISTPFRSTLTEALQLRDFKWVRRAAIFMFVANGSLGVLGFLVFGVFGEQLFAVWYKGAVAPDSNELWGMAVYFLILSLEVTNFTFLSSIGFLHSASRWTLVKAVFAASCIVLLLASGQFGLQFWVLAMSSVLLSLIPLGIVTVTQTPMNQDAFRSNDGKDSGPASLIPTLQLQSLKTDAQADRWKE